MGKTFQLPNEASCPSVEEFQAAQNARDQTKMATGEYKTVNTLSMSSVSRVRKVTPANESDVSAVTLTKQGTDVQKLKWICASLAISTVIISTTFGVLTHNMVGSVFKHYENKLRSGTDTVGNAYTFP